MVIKWCSAVLFLATHKKKINLKKTTKKQCHKIRSCLVLQTTCELDYYLSGNVKNTEEKVWMVDDKRVKETTVEGDWMMAHIAAYNNGEGEWGTYGQPQHLSHCMLSIRPSNNRRSELKNKYQTPWWEWRYHLLASMRKKCNVAIWSH